MTFHHDAEIFEHPYPRWIIKPLFHQRSIVILYGPPEVGKSFIAIDWAYHLATGAGSWFDHSMKPGEVVYVAGEGIGGLRSRIEAWHIAHPDEMIFPVHYKLGPVQLHKEKAVDQFLRDLGREAPYPRLIVFDTLARCSVGLDENKTETMGTVIESCDRLKRETDAAILLLHHPARPQKDVPMHLRGSSGIDGAADTIILAQRAKDDAIELSCEKQKEAKHFWPVYVRLEEVVVNAKKDIKSAVLAPRQPASTRVK